MSVLDFRLSPVCLSLACLMVKRGKLESLVLIKKTSNSICNADQITLNSEKEKFKELSQKLVPKQDSIIFDSDVHPEAS